MKAIISAEFRVEIEPDLEKRLTRFHKEAIAKEVRNRVQIALEGDASIMENLTVGHIADFRVSGATFEN